MSSQQRAQQRAWGFGLATVHGSGAVLDTWYPGPALGDASWSDLPPGLEELTGPDARRDVRLEVVRTEIDLDAAPADVPDAYLRLHLLSHRLVRPHGLDLSGIFGVLANVVWTSQGPCHPEGFETTRARLRSAGPLQVLGVDKFPRMVDYVLPAGVRIADGNRVRLGAHLADGTTVMHEGFVNYNAGTLGTSMVEGRISAGVVVGDGSDVGGGASIMGTLSGGGTAVISIGQRCLLGANSGIGISLGDDCVVEAGCYVTAGTKVTLRGRPDGDSESDSERADGGGNGSSDVSGGGGKGGSGNGSGSAGNRVVKAAELSGRSNLMFWRNSVTGAVEVTARKGTWGSLNDALHAN